MEDQQYQNPRDELHQLQRKVEEIQRGGPGLGGRDFLMGILNRDAGGGGSKARGYPGMVLSMASSRYCRSPGKLALTHGAFIGLSRCLRTSGDWNWIMKHEGVLENHSKDFNSRFPLNLDHSGKYLSEMGGANVEGVKLFLEDMANSRHFAGSLS
jgi:hypothetical protein